MSNPTELPFIRLSQHVGYARRRNAFPFRGGRQRARCCHFRGESGTRRPGHTLLELLFVLLIVGIVATVVVPPMLSSQQKMRVDAAVQQLTIDLARARSEAMKLNQAVTVAQTGTNTYTLSSVADRQLEADVTFGTGAATTVAFTSSGTLTPVESRTMVVQLGSHTRSVVISSAGFARVQ